MYHKIEVKASGRYTKACNGDGRKSGQGAVRDLRRRLVGLAGRRGLRRSGERDHREVPGVWPAVSTAPTTAARLSTAPHADAGDAVLPQRVECRLEDSAQIGRAHV